MLVYPREIHGYGSKLKTRGTIDFLSVAVVLTIHFSSYQAGEVLSRLEAFDFRGPVLRISWGDLIGWDLGAM